MRLLWWLLLLLTLLSGANSTSSTLSILDTANVDSVIPEPAVFAKYATKRVRGLRVEENKVVGEDFIPEERSYLISSIVNGGNKALSGIKARLAAQAQRLYDYSVERTFILAYNKGITPATLRAKLMGKKNPLVREYKLWWEVVRATGKVPPRKHFALKA